MKYRNFGEVSLREIKKKEYFGTYGSEREIWK